MMNYEVTSACKLWKFIFCLLLLKMHCFLCLRLVCIQILVHRHISLNVTNCSNYSDEVQGWHHYDDVIMSPAHLTGSNRKVPKDISVMDEYLLVYCLFVKINYNLDLNKSYLWLSRDKKTHARNNKTCTVQKVISCREIFLDFWLDCWCVCVLKCSLKVIRSNVNPIYRNSMDPTVILLSQ